MVKFNILNVLIEPVIYLILPKEACLISDTIHYFVQNDMTFHPSYVADDVQKAIGSVHKSFQLYRTVLKHPDKYLKKSSKLVIKTIERD